MKTENTVTISLQDYEYLKRSNEGMKNALKNFKANAIVLEKDKSMFSFGTPTLKILNPDEATKMVNDLLVSSRNDVDSLKKEIKKLKYERSLITKILYSCAIAFIILIIIKSYMS